MEQTAPTRLVVKMTCGVESLERLNQGFMVASLAIASGVEVSLWLTGDATWLATPGRAEEVILEHAAPLADLRDAVLGGGRLVVCSQCAVRRGIDQGDLVTGVVIEGAASFVEQIMQPATQALVY